MPHDFANRGPANCSRINLRNESERRYWMRELGCSAEELNLAVAEAGCSVSRVKNHLSAAAHSAVRFACRSWR